MERISESERLTSLSLAIANVRDLARRVDRVQLVTMLGTYFPELTVKERNDDRDQADMRDGGGSAAQDGGAAPRIEYHFWLGAEGHRPGRAYAQREHNERRSSALADPRLQRIDPAEYADGLYRIPEGTVVRVARAAEARSGPTEEERVYRCRVCHRPEHVGDCRRYR